MLLTVKVVTRSSKPAVLVESDSTLKVRLQSPPVEGAANAELIEMLAQAFGLPRRAVTIVGGAHSRSKRVRLEGLDEGNVRAVLASLKGA